MTESQNDVILRRPVPIDPKFRSFTEKCSDKRCLYEIINSNALTTAAPKQSPSTLPKMTPKVASKMSKLSSKLSICEKFEKNFRPPDPRISVDGKNFQRLTVKPSNGLKTHRENLLKILDTEKNFFETKKSEMKQRAGIMNFGCQLEQFFLQRTFLKMPFQKLKRLQKVISNLDQKQIESFNLDLKSPKDWLAITHGP